MFRRYPCVRQTAQSDCGAAALATTALHYWPKGPHTIRAVGEITMDSNTAFGRDAIANVSRRSAIRGRRLLATFAAPLLLGLAMPLATAAVAHAGTFIVDNLEDRDVDADGCVLFPNQGRCRLRTAMRLAGVNANGSNTIRLVGGKDGRKDYRLNSSLPSISNILVIEGDGDDTKIWGPCPNTIRGTATGHCDRNVAFDRAIFFVNPKGNLTLSNLAIHNGWSEKTGAGGVVSQGSLLLDRVAIVGSGAHFGPGAIWIDSGVATIERSTIRDNTSHHGPSGGILVKPGAFLTITNSTISGNKSLSSDGKFTTMPPMAGGISNEGLLAITSSTIVENKITVLVGMDSIEPFTANREREPEAGGIANKGEVWANNVTIAGNSVMGAKNLPGGQFFFFNSVIAANGERDADGLDNPDCFGAFTSLRGNVVGEPGKKDAAGKFLCDITDWASLPKAKASDLIGRRNFSGPIPVANIFKKGAIIGGIFHPAFEYDGGHTCTVPLCSGLGNNDINCASRATGFATNAGWSASLNPGGIGCSPRDQRDAGRTNTCDAGAYEISGLPDFFKDEMNCFGLESPPPQ
jgi:hypothetical protein